MNPDRVLYRNSVLWFGVFSAFVLIAFWPSYFSRLSAQPEIRFHTHGLAMTLWCALLIAQAWLMRTNRKQMHRQLGKASYVLVPFVVIATVNLAHFRIKGSLPLTGGSLYFLSLILNALLVFLVLFGLAIYYRRKPSVHARYMVCTIFPMFTPVTDRLIFAHMPVLVRLVPVIDGSPVVPVLGFALADILLVALSVWDWRRHHRTDVFPMALVILVAYHVSVLTFYKFGLWKAFSEWFVALPLS